MSTQIESICQQARATARVLAQVSAADKNAALLRVADAIWDARNGVR